MTIDKKPLELRVFDNIARHAEGWEIASDSAPVRTWRTIPIDLADAFARGKHLTPAQCAAEYWAAAGHVSKVAGYAKRGGKMSALNQARTLERFATLPHAAEKDYE